MDINGLFPERSKWLGRMLSEIAPQIVLAGEKWENTQMGSSSYIGDINSNSTYAWCVCAWSTFAKLLQKLHIDAVDPPHWNNVNPGNQWNLRINSTKKPNGREEINKNEAKYGQTIPLIDIICLFTTLAYTTW